ncbi:MAG: BTAD domain-containing putative transcriptional regulator [Rubrivivax sp.]
MSANATHLLARKDAALLAVVALDGPTAAARLAAWLWPEVDARAASNNLRQRIHRLRRGAGHALLSTSTVVELDPMVSADLEPALAALAHDADAASGELLGAFDYADLAELDDWVRAAREHWSGRRAQALAAAASQLEQAGELARAIAFAARLVAEQPQAEHAHRRLMRLHYLRGDRAAALAAFQQCRQTLDRSFGTLPGHETTGLAALIERSGTLAVAADRPAPPLVAVLRPPRLVGRETEWGLLQRAALAGRTVVVSGEPGIGKSRLLGDHAAGRRATAAGARPGDARVPYALLARLVRAARAPDARCEPWIAAELARIVPEIGPPAEGRLDALRLRLALGAALEASGAAGSATVVLDDLHGADDASLELLPGLIADTRSRLHWVLATRADEMPALLAAWIDACDADAVLRLDLGPLTLEATEALLRSLALPQLDAHTCAAPLHRHTGGNPLFILETLRALGPAPTWPTGSVRLPVAVEVGRLIDRRLARLSAPALRLARVAALAGTDFDAALAARVLGVHALDLAEPWRELEAAQVIHAQGFAHDLVLEATLRSVPQPIALVLHRAIAAVLEADAAPPARVAPHWLAALEWSRAGRAYAAAALEARRLSQRAGEVERWGSACRCLEAAGDHDAAFDARRESIEALILVGGIERARPAVERLRADARSDAQRVAALTAQAQLSLMSADTAAGIAAAREAHGLAAGFTSAWPGFEAARLLAVGLSQSDRADDALRVIEPFRDLVEREGSREQRARFWADYAYALNAARQLRRTAEALSRAAEHARALGDHGELATLTSNLALVQGNLGRVDLAHDQALRARALQCQLGETDGPAGAAIEMYIGMYAAMLGRYGEALSSLDAALDTFARDRQPLWFAVASHHKAVVMIDLAQFARARQALDYDRAGTDAVAARRTTLQARLGRCAGHGHETPARDATALATSGGDLFVRMLGALEDAHALPAAQAVSRCDEVLAIATRLEYEGVALKARLWRARHGLRTGDAEGAAAGLHALLPRLEVMQPADMSVAEAWWLAFEILEAHDETAAATTALRRAEHWIREVALPHVPEPFRESFLARNPVNRAVLTTAGRRAGG